MVLSEGMLTAGAGVVEFGFPIVLIWLIRISNRWRRRAVVVIGALTPLFVFFAAACTGALIESPLNWTSAGYFFALWIVSFVFYAATALLGLVISFSKRPSGCGLASP